MKVLVISTLMISVFSIWIAVFQSAIILYGALRHAKKELTKKTNYAKDNLPTVTIMVPAHNEAAVIEGTLRKIFSLSYPNELLQTIVINDNSSDDSKDILENLQKIYDMKNFMIINTDETNGGKGKSGALNIGVKYAEGELIAIYDADAAPERNALLFLVNKYLEDDNYAAAFGRNKNRNRERNILTRFINLELIVSQKVVHTGKWELFKIGQIPGTNFVISKKILESVGYWDEGALTEDTLLGYKIMNAGYKIALETKSEAYQQEPERLSVYLKQRIRWAKGNNAASLSNLKDKNSKSMLETFFSLSSSVWYLTAIILSDIIFLVSVATYVLSLFHIGTPFRIDAPDYLVNVLTISWAAMFVLFVLQINFALITDIGQSTFSNFLYAGLSYFTYSQLYIYISTRALISGIFDKIFHKKAKWYKTERF